MKKILCLISIIFAIYKIIHPTKKTFLESRINTVDWEHESYPIDWQHQVFKRMLHQAVNDVGKESNFDDDLGNKRLSLSQCANVESTVVGEQTLL